MNRPSGRPKRSRRWIWSEPGIFLSSALVPTRTRYNQRLVVEKPGQKKVRHPHRGAVLYTNLVRLFYLPAISKFTFVSSFAFTVTFCVVLPSFCCQTSTV